MTGNSTRHDIPTLKVDDQRYMTQKEKATAIAEAIRKNSSDQNYSAKFQNRKKEYEESERRKERNETEGEIHPELNENFVFHEMEKSIRQGNKNKAPGEDRIHYEMLQNIPKQHKKILLKIYNEIWKKGKMPAQ